jgi:hypothetical protein
MPEAARPRGRHFLAGTLLLAASLPLGVLVTLVLLPFWRWLERSFAVESVGHSGPAEWCYLVTMAACAAGLGLLYRIRAR